MLQSVYIFNGTSSLTQQLKHLADFLYVYRTKNRRPETANRSLQTSNIHTKGVPTVICTVSSCFLTQTRIWNRERWRRYHSRRCIRLHTIYEEKRADAGAQTRWSVTVYLYFVIYNTSYLLFVICYLQYKSCDGPLQICTQAFFNTVPIRNIWQIWQIYCFGGFLILTNTQTVYAIKWKYLAEFSQVPPPPFLNVWVVKTVGGFFKSPAPTPTNTYCTL
jgi:hypothetical protein